VPVEKCQEVSNLVISILILIVIVQHPGEGCDTAQQGKQSPESADLKS